MDRDDHRALKSVPAFLLGLLLGGGAVYGLMPRAAAPDPNSASDADVERVSGQPAPPQAVTIVGEPAETGRNAPGPIVKAAPRPVPAADSATDAEITDDDDRLKAIR